MSEEKEGPYEIGEIDFKDIKVKVYHDKYSPSISTGGCAWQMRNPDSCYKGFMNMNIKTGKITYPEGAVIPKQTIRDREMLPKFIIVPDSELTETVIKTIKKYLETEYKLRNKNDERS